MQRVQGAKNPPVFKYLYSLSGGGRELFVIQECSEDNDQVAGCAALESGSVGEVMPSQSDDEAKLRPITVEMLNAALRKAVKEIEILHNKEMNMSYDQFAYESRPVGDQEKAEIEKLREEFKALAAKIAALKSPTDGRLLSLCKTNLEQACMWIVKEITHAGENLP